MPKRKKNTKKKKLFLGIIGIVLIIGAAITFPSYYNKIKLNQETPKPEEKKLQIIDLESHTRPIAVMINNIDVARPYQAGLQDAYLVYEMIVEGGITRMMAVFKDVDTAKIGTIRSARHYYLDYALENDAIYVHWGQSDYAANDISRLDIQNLNGMIYGNTYFWRDKTLKVSTEHTAYSSIELIQKGAEKLKYRTTSTVSPLLHYSVEEVDLSSIEGVIPANQIAIRYSKNAETEYVYDPDTQNYKRSVNGISHVDYDTKRQYTAKNIITYQVKNSTVSGDAKGRQDLDNLGTGTGYYISNGYAVPINWEKKSRSSKTIYKLKDGTELKVNDGNTFIQIQPKGEVLTIS